MTDVKRTYRDDWEYLDEPDGVASGFAYGEVTSDVLQENLHIEEVNHEEGKYLLVLGNEQWLSDDLPALEARLFEWARSEGYDV